MVSLSNNLLPVLQLTRMALVFTAIADSLCALFLWAQWRIIHEPGLELHHVLTPMHFIAVIGISVGLYGFGMSLNDIIDRRRDRLMASHRPIPSGRIGVLTAYIICVLLALLTLAGGILLMWLMPGMQGWVSLAVLIWTGLLIVFYDVAGKYLVAPGIISLGLIRLFHGIVPAPQIPLIWHPLLLLNHVALLSAVAYRWQEKRPILRRVHARIILSALLALNLVMIVLVWWRRTQPGMSLAESLWLEPAIVLPFLAALMFIAIGYSIYWWSDTPRQAGQTVMLCGLLWLIVYDAAFVFGYVNWVAGLVVLSLLPVAYLSMQAMRWWTRLMALSQRPAFKRAEV